MFDIIFKKFFYKKQKQDVQNLYFKQINEKLNKFNKLETNITDLQLTIEDMLEDMNNTRDEYNNKLLELEQKHDKETLSLVNSLIASGDMIEDFLTYAKQSNDDALETQAKIMLQSFIKKASSSNLVRIQNECTSPDPRYDIATSSDYDDTVPKGHIIYNLRSGYLYNNNLVRKSTVVISNGKKINLSIISEDNNL